MRKPAKREEMSTIESNSSNDVMTHAQLAEKLGVNRQVITWHAKKPAAPPLHDLEAWRAYLDDKLAATGGKLTDKLARQRLRKWTADANIAEREDKLKAGEFELFSEVRKMALEVMSHVFGELDRWRQTWPALLKGRTEHEIASVIDQETQAFRLGVRARLERFIEK